MKSVSSRDFNQDLSGAKRAALDGPVFITDRGRPSFVLLSIDEYQSLTDAKLTLSDAFAQLSPGIKDEVEFPRSLDDAPRPADLSD
ncbi:hypothetical protein AB833_15430 [Chromatiales bacterium (ex Bugula neritina AB1)]|nr:hypothetical protein AB833_15430 [Chromatiales bacterium (ex Bugula neritina AB1)]